MPRLELIDAYVSGRIGRREFIRGLAALGVSMSAATAHAVALRPAAANHRDDDLYPDPTKKRQCKNGGYVKFGFHNRRQCRRFVRRRRRQ